MKKSAGIGHVGQEELARVKGQILTRTDIKAAADVLFENGPKSRQEERSYIEKLFIQAGGAEVNPMLSKEGMAKNVSGFFEKKAYLSEAQRNFPELLKVADSGEPKKVPQLKKQTTSPDKGTTPVQSAMSGGSA